MRLGKTGVACTVVVPGVVATNTTVEKLVVSTVLTVVDSTTLVISVGALVVYAVLVLVLLPMNSGPCRSRSS